MKWGTLYRPEYVNCLYAMVRRQTSGSLRFVCLTDDPGGIHPEVECHECPGVSIPPPHDRAGWRKISLYAQSDELFGFEGDWLFLDLDVVVTHSLDPFFEYQPEKAFIVMKNWTQPGKNIGNTSVFRFRIGACSYLLEKLEQCYVSILKEYANSQTYISHTVKDLTFWPDDWCVLFKVQCVPSWPFRFWKEPILPPGARIVAFPGVPNPHEAVRGQWPVKKAWKRLYKFIQPANWINDYWKE